MIDDFRPLGYLGTTAWGTGYLQSADLIRENPPHRCSSAFYYFIWLNRYRNRKRDGRCCWDHVLAILVAVG